MPPRFIKKLNNKVVKTNSIAKLTVRVEGDPEPGITWFKDGREIPDAGM